jgi:hypothetical protein
MPPRIDLEKDIIMIQEPVGYIFTTWELSTYDVLGNARDGYEVNDFYAVHVVEINIPQTRYNTGTKYEFLGAAPTDRQIKKAFGLRCQIRTEGDDMQIFVERERDGYPIGQMICISHESLSPVRKKKA